MSLTIKITNEFGNELTNQQLNSISSFSKVYIEDNIPIKKERYENNQLVNTSFFVSSWQQLNTILADNPSVSFRLTYIQDNYSIMEILSYSNSVLISKSITVYHLNGNSICFRKFKVINGVATSSRTEKYFYNNEGLKYSFEYNDDNTCFLIYDEQDFQGDIYGWNIGDRDYTDFTWTGFEYYEFAEPLIPSN